MNRPTAHFLHIGKTGGHAIKNALRPFSKAGFYEIEITVGHRLLKRYPVGEPFFFVVRDPITRFTSAFYECLKNGVSKRHKVEIDVFARFANPNELTEALYAQDELAQDAFIEIGHLKPMVHYFEDLETLKKRSEDILLVCHQETLSADFEVLRKKLGLPKNCQLPLNPKTANKTPKDKHRNLSSRSIEVLTDQYQLDYELVKYCEGFRLSAY